MGFCFPVTIQWVKNSNGDSKAFECLSFDREKEKFTNVEKDHIQENVMVKDPKTGEEKPITCQWSYAVQVISDNKLQTFNLKKKMFQQIVENAPKLGGDPTDIDEGYDIVVTRKKTGPHAFNVEYTLDVITMMQNGKRPLSEEERELLKEMKPIDELIPRPTPDEQLAELEKFLSGEDDSAGTPSNSTDNTNRS